jgi:hypothetical protein
MNLLRIIYLVLYGQSICETDPPNPASQIIWVQYDIIFCYLSETFVFQISGGVNDLEAGLSGANLHVLFIIVCNYEITNHLSILRN